MLAIHTSSGGRCVRSTAAALALGLLGAVAAAAPGAARADIWIFVDERGAVHLSDQRVDSRYQMAYRDSPAAGAVASVPVAAVHGAGPQRAYDPLIAAAARRHGVPAELVRAVIRVESGFNARAVSPKGAAGLMQLMPATAARYGVADRMDAAENVQAGTRYLAELLSLFKQDLRLALAAYNAGEEAVLRYRNIPPYAETRSYVERVLSTYRGAKAI